MDNIPSEIIEAARCAADAVLPTISKDRCKKVYTEFKVWQAAKGSSTLSETVLLAYFYEMAKKCKPTSLWAYYSMLKSTIRSNDNIDIGGYTQISAFLKTNASGYVPTKAYVFSEREIKQFIDEACDKIWLDVKVVCVFGISGALRTDELKDITINDIKDHGDLLLVQIPKTKTKVPRSFTITKEFYAIVQKYVALRPANFTDKRFFLNYQNGRCTKKFIGVNKFKMMPRRIATFLGLAEPERYTGHSVRRSSATILANSPGVTMETVKRHWSWRSSTVAEGYIEDSLQYKRRTANPTVCNHQIKNLN